MNGDWTATGGRQWYVVRSKPRRESYAQEQLARRGVETFLPRIWEPPRGRIGPTIGPLFPGYLFARFSLPAELGRVIWTPGVRTLVAFGEAPAAVEPEVVEFLRERCGPTGILRHQRVFHAGERVCVRQGPLAGLVGIVERYVPGRTRVNVLMQILRQQTRVSVPVELLEPVAL